jgi:phage tail-like protein
MGVIGSARSFYHKYAFTVAIDTFASADFNKCSELSMEIAKVEHSEGGSLIPRTQPGRVSFTDITLERGATSDLDMYNWTKDVVNVAANSGLVDDEYKRNADINQKDRDGNTRAKWRVTNGWPTKFVAGDWDNDADEVVIESITVTYDFFDSA